MSYEYAQRTRTAAPTAASAPSAAPVQNAPAQFSMPNSARLAMLENMENMNSKGTAAMTDRNRVDLPDAVRQKMEGSFGMDFSAVKLYTSQSVSDFGADAVAQGHEILFAPGKLDFTSRSGQALLGHEFSHVASQARGEVRGSGYLDDSGLEARADREGAMAAAGKSIYGGASAPLSAASAPLSAASAPLSAAGPMQAKKNYGYHERTAANLAKAWATIGTKDFDAENFRNLFLTAYNDSKIVEALFNLRSEKRKIEMGGENASTREKILRMCGQYHGQDRYDAVIRMLMQKAYVEDVDQGNRTNVYDTKKGLFTSGRLADWTAYNNLLGAGGEYGSPDKYATSTQWMEYVMKDKKRKRNYQQASAWENGVQATVNANLALIGGTNADGTNGEINKLVELGLMDPIEPYKV